MERWEPRRTPIQETPRKRWRRPQFPSRDLPEIWLMVGTRLGITFLLTIAVLFEGLRDQMHLAVIVLLAGLGVLIQQSNQDRTRRLRDQCITDLAIFITIVPMAIFSGFVAAEPGELLPAERSAFIETSIGLVAALVIVVALGSWLFSGERSLLALIVLPAMLITVSLAFVLHDYRNQTVIAMLAVSYFVGAAAIALGVIVEEPIRRYLGAIFYVSTVMAGALLFDPGLGNLIDREPLIQVVSTAMIVLGMLVLTMIPLPSFQPADLLAELKGGSQRRTGSRRSTRGS